MLVGNDIVDLNDPESTLEALHPRFTQRVFSEEERARIARSPDPRSTLWTLWAAKESAYKIALKQEPTAVFSPRAFAVGFDGPRQGASGSGRVRSASPGVCFRTSRGESWVHVVAWSGPTRLAWRGLVCGVHRCPAGCDPSRLARSHARTAVARALGIGRDEVRIEGDRPPRLGGAGVLWGADLSLSHHGAYTAFAVWLSPGAGGACPSLE